MTDDAVTLSADLAELENFKVLAVALAIGLLIGLERGWAARGEAEGRRVAGLRTYGLLSLLGGFWAMLARQAEPAVMGFAFLGVTLLILVSYHSSLKKFENFSITGSVASLTAFSLGALAVFGHAVLASAFAVIITVLLGYKPVLHGWLNKLDQQEIHATLKLLLISVVVLPVLPDKNYGPWQALNPYHVWWMVVLIAAISYLGYFAIRIVGNRHGPMLTGIFGGLVSSTAVSINLSRMAKLHPELSNALAAGVLTACATMFARIALVTSIFNPALCQLLLPSMLLMSLLTYLAAFLLWRRASDYQSDAEIALENPFQIGMALKFGGLLLAVMLLSKAMKIYFGDMGTYFLAAVSGVVDVDAITLSMAHASRTASELDVASFAILIAVLANSTFKSLLAWLLGSAAFAGRVAFGSMLVVALGLITFWRLTW